MPELYDLPTAGGVERAPAPHPVARRPSRDDRAVGWVVSAALVLAVLGVLNVMYGIAAISRSTFYVRDARYMFGDLNTYGWVLLVLGVAQLCASLGILAWARWARWVGIASAGANAVAQLLFLPSAPLLALALFGADLLVLYGLIAYGGRRTA
jgi:hypothetical protein